ncbi:MAG TPA: hypothetical protein EYG73_03075 [Arcobacter sp.]|nr:hypothetical protein [Arcobacter sp.]
MIDKNTKHEEILQNILDTSIQENKKLKSTTKHILQVTNESNKNKQISRYIQALDNKTKVLIILSSSFKAHELKKQINRKDKNKAISICNKTPKLINDLDKKQVIIVTQDNYIANTYNDYSKKRDLIIIDDSISLFKDFQIKNQDLKNLKNLVDSICKEDKKAFQNIKNEYDILNKFIFISNGIHIEISNDKKKKAFLIDDTKSIKSSKFLKLRKIIKDNNCSSILLEVACNKSKEKDFKKILLTHLDTIELISKNWFYYYSENSTVQNSTLNVIESKLPNKSLVILSTTANINHTYQLLDDTILYDDKFPTNKNIDLCINKTVDTNINSILQNPYQNANILLTTLEKNISKDTKTLIITHEKLISYFLDFKTTYNYEVLSFEDMKDTNSLEEFDNIVIYSTPKEKKTVYINQHCLCATNLEQIEDITTTNKLEDTIIASKIIDIINKTKDLKVTIYFTLGTDKKSKILDYIQDSIKNIKTKNWAIPKKQKTTLKKISWTNSIISYLKSNIKQTKDLTPVEVMKNVNVPKSTFNKLCAKEEFQNKLKENKIELRLPNDSKRGKIFYTI